MDTQERSGGREQLPVRQTKTGLLEGAVFAAELGLVLLLSACTSHKCTKPTWSDSFAVSQYFPLDYGDNWTWDLVADGLQEHYVDGDSSLGEPFTDLNGNARRDQNEPFEDFNWNGKYDAPSDPWTPGIPYVDRNDNGTFEYPNDVWEEGELFLDLDGNGMCSQAETLTFYASILYPNPQNGVMFRGGQFLGTWSNGQAGGQKGDTDGFSNDSLGLRWHSHLHRSGPTGDYLSGCKPIIIAEDNMSLGDSVITHCPYYPYASWFSVFEAVENVTVPAGTFLNCLKFRSVASGWRQSLEMLNGTSCQWYAKGVGLVKFEGPKDGEHWLLKSANVAGQNYP